MGEAILCNQFLVAPQFCENSQDLAELGELDYISAGGGLYETRALREHTPLPRELKFLDYHENPP